MKIQIDTTAKTIKVEQKVKFAALVTALDALFPDDAWKEFDLLPDVITNYANPISWGYHPWPYSPFYYGGTIGIGSTHSHDFIVNSPGTYTVACGPGGMLSSVTIGDGGRVSDIGELGSKYASGIYTLDIAEN